MMRHSSDDIARACKMLDEASGILGGGPLSFYLRELNESYKILIDRFAPFKPGSRVKLKKTPDITPEKAHGWMGCRHFLVKGAKATVEEVGCGEGGFSFHIIFDDETWIDTEDKKREPKSKHHFSFREECLEAA